jgi:hypothetical protein
MENIWFDHDQLKETLKLSDITQRRKSLQLMVPINVRFN